MRPPTGFADLAGRRVGIFGYGVEGRAAEARLSGRCDLVLVDDRDRGPAVLRSDLGGLEALASCEVVLKSPGVPRRRDDVLALEAAGVVVTSALNLWLHEIDRSRVVAVTGTKGKSTTTALVTFCLESLGMVAHSLGNIGRPPYDPSLDTDEGLLVVEVSSFQSVDLTVAPGVVVVTALGADHLDWHGSLEQYHRDKLSLTRASGEHVTLVADLAALRASAELMGGRVRFVPGDEAPLRRALGLVGSHNDTNVALALVAAAEITGESVAAVRARTTERAGAFEPLPGRLTLVARESVGSTTRRYVDDGLATSVVATLGALEVFGGEPLALIAGGFDRGVDYGELARALVARSAATALVALGPAGERLAVSVELLGGAVIVERAGSMADAVKRARALVTGGVILLSPAAASFDQYQNWEERSAHFRAVVMEQTNSAPTTK